MSQRISIVIPVLNAARTLSQCLEALVSQVSAEDEVFVVDNNSSDASREIAWGTAGVRLLQESKQGSYAARNLGCSEASGDILAFIDPDCVPAPQWRNALLEALSDPSIELILGGRSFGKNSRALDLISQYEEARTSWVYSQEDTALFYGYCNNMAVRRSLWDEIGPFVERERGSDTIFVQHALKQRSTAIARHVPRMHVKHLEIDSLTSYFGKMRTYGRSSRLYRPIAHTRPLDGAERLGVMRRVFREQRLPLAARTILFSMLVTGLLCWTFGSLSARWARDDRE